MSGYSIEIADTSRCLSIEREGADDVPRYATESFFYGCEYVEEDSSLMIASDIRTCEILRIGYSGVFYGMEAAYLEDYDQYEELEEKPKASFIPPRGAEGIGLGYYRDFTFYYSKESIKMLLEEGEPYYRYSDGRLTIYYDDDYTLLTIFIGGVTEEEYKSLRARKQRRKRF